MRLPQTIDSQWIDKLEDEELRAAEGALHAVFSKHDRRERRDRGERYDLFRGPETLLLAWTRWSTVNNATRARGLRTLTRS